MKILHLLLIIPKVLIFLELTFIADWGLCHHGWIPLLQGLVNSDGMSIQSKLAMM
jgi:hypothetical protein